MVRLFLSTAENLLTIAALFIFSSNPNPMTITPANSEQSLFLSNEEINSFLLLDLDEDSMNDASVTV
ncbi:hypothetical protein AM1_5890 [Acaryochloris marina MBIC11017]|uniref:Uncharacterized protein n=1 Tax=Acaryochloris marina (strain MBIC 11017) TaxID=329726 RepID=B0C1J5_ACAM1|nr:hypothetical protein AM1_5890 [Acaryochloris marina MBIC11017]